MKTVKLTANEIRAIEAGLWSNPCRSGCAYPEMQNSRKSCDECKLTEARDSIMEKLDLLGVVYSEE